MFLRLVSFPLFFQLPAHTGFRLRDSRSPRTDCPGPAEVSTVAACERHAAFPSLARCERTLSDASVGGQREAGAGSFLHLWPDGRLCRGLAGTHREQATAAIRDCIQYLDCSILS